MPYDEAIYASKSLFTTNKSQVPLFRKLAQYVACIERNVHDKCILIYGAGLLENTGGKGGFSIQ